MGRPGIMLYFDILEPIRMLPDEDKGRLLVAMLEYGRDGTVPELEGALGIVWSFIQPKIDRDEENYDASKLQRQYAAFCKKRKRIWMPRIPFEDWIVMTDDERQRAVDPVASRNPSASTTAAVSSIHHPSSINHHHQQQPSASTETTATSDEWEESAAAAADRELKAFGGRLGQNVVFLTDEQVGDLLDRLGLDLFERYVEKLSDFIIRNNAKVKNHYETILKWWREDSQVNSG